MAILEGLPGIKVVVCTGGQPMTEYSTENDEIVHTDQAVVDHQQKVTVTKYIESVTGQEFTIELNVKTPYKLDCPHLGFVVSVDGKLVWGPLMDQQDFHGMAFHCVVEGPISKSGKTTQVHLMKFAAIETTSETLPNEIIGEQKEAVSRLGEISIKIYRYSAGKMVKSSAQEFGGVPSTPNIHEKALKGESKSHSVSLRASKNVPFGNTYECDKLDGSDYPIAIFKFKYRSREALKSLLVVPRSPSPEPATLPQAETANPEPGYGTSASLNAPNLFSLTPKELALLQQLLHRASGGGVGLLGSNNIKQDPSSVGPDRPIKREIDENKGRASKRCRRLPGKMIIDLTEDDVEDREVVPVD